MNNFEAVERSNERRELVYIWLESSEVGEVVDDWVLWEWSERGLRRTGRTCYKTICETREGCHHISTDWSERSRQYFLISPEIVSLPTVIADQVHPVLFFLLPNPPLFSSFAVFDEAQSSVPKRRDDVKLLLKDLRETWREGRGVRLEGQRVRKEELRQTVESWVLLHLQWEVID